MKKFLLILTLVATGASAQTYPSKPIRLVVAFPPGGPVDIVARLVGPKLGEALGQPVVVENKAGASGNIATVDVAKSAPDGYTLLTHSSAYAVNPTLYSNAGYDPTKDLAAVAVVASQANIILVNSTFPASTLDELRKQMLSRKLAYGSPGSGTTPHLTAQNLFQVRWKADATHIPFKGAGPMVAALLGGEPAIGCMAGSGPMANIRAGKFRALAVSSSKRLPQLPDVPTLGELGYSGMEDYTWVGMFAPAGTPAEVLQKLNAAIVRIAQDPETRKRLETVAFDVTAAPLRETADYVRSEVAKWAQVVRETGAKVD
ncbi:MAG TPA: tripartite tricarboxylate transporter substrate binding protein [Burkholderiales bacterium]|nr:tripartite tricarboxylate transporter substrate binding protein [Burkholderiales bacterium]